MWKYTTDSKPLTYKTGNWDGRNSDQVLAQDKDGKNYIAHFCDGVMDGSKFEDWYDDRSYLIEAEIVRYMKIPD